MFNKFSSKGKTLPLPLRPTVYASIIFFWAGLLFYVTALRQNISPKILFSQFLNAFYIPHFNLCPAGAIGRFNIYLYFYLLILCSFSSIRIFRKILKNPNDTQSVLGELQRVVTIVFAIIVLFQTMNQVRYFVVHFQMYNGKNIEARRFGILKETYDFAQYCKKSLPGPHNAELITDLDTSRDPGMFTHRALAYYLYPIDIRGIRKGTKDVLIGFKKANAIRDISEKYELIGSMDKNNIWAGKRKDF